MQNRLPQGWVECKLEDIVTFSQGIQVPINKQYETPKENYMQFLRIVDFTQPNTIPRYIEKVDSKYQVQKDDISMVRYGTVGFVCTGKSGILANNLFKFNIKSNSIFNRFLYYYLRSIKFIKYLDPKGATMQALSFTQLYPIPLLLPTFNEQKRIVEKIESEFEKIDNSIEKLTLIQEQIKQYKQSVLKSAFEGKLYKTTEWEEKTLEKISFKISDGSHNPPTKQEVGIPMLSGQNIKNNSIIFDTYRLIKENEYEKEYKRTPIETGDILLTIVGTIGESAIVPEDISKFCIQRSVALIKPIINSKYLKYYFDSPKAKYYFSTKQRGTAQKGIYLNTLRDLNVKYPTKDFEQQKIVEEIEKRFSVADNLLEIVNDSLEKAKQLKQSILKKAFEGRLVPQDPTDEPASKLLERIKAEREKI